MARPILLRPASPLAHRLKDRSRALDLKGQNALARYLGVDRGTLSRYLRGLAPLTFGLARRILVVFPELRADVAAELVVVAETSVEAA